MTVDERSEEGSGGVERQGADVNPTTEVPAQSSQSSVEVPPPPPPAPQATDAVAGLAQTEKAPEERKALLANTLQGQVAGGARIESQGDFQAVVVSGHRVNHLLHFFIGLFTLGVWWIVWFFIAIFGGETRRMVNVDQFGNVFVQKV